MFPPMPNQARARFPDTSVDIELATLGMIALEDTNCIYIDPVLPQDQANHFPQQIDD
jgi:hypothetical protein